MDAALSNSPSEQSMGIDCATQEGDRDEITKCQYASTRRWEQQSSCLDSILATRLSNRSRDVHSAVGPEADVELTSVRLSVSSNFGSYRRSPCDRTANRFHYQTRYVHTLSPLGYSGSVTSLSPKLCFCAGSGSSVRLNTSTGTPSH